jgi:8-amino-7-oxononanoate synthase
VCGRTTWYRELELGLARFEGAEAAILFPTGYAANVGTIAAVAGPRDEVYSDRLNHASLIDGCRLSGAKLQVYPHCDVDFLESLLRKSLSLNSCRRRLIVTDSIFSMDGDLAPLPALCDVAERYHAMLLVDEAHATGVFGARGRGVAELQGVKVRGLIRVGTLSKAIGSQGGFVAGSDALVDWLWNNARTQIFSTALSPAACSAACAAVGIIDSEDGRERRESLTASARLFRQLLRERQVVPLGDESSPIVPIVFGAPETAVAAADHLQSIGFLVGAIRPPSVPRGTSRLRISLTCAHSEEVLRQLARAVEKCQALPGLQ